MNARPALLDLPVAGLYPVALNVANDLLREWGHRLGAVERPFHSEAFVLQLHDEPIAVAVSASIVSSTVSGYRRSEVVELARQAAKVRWANRVMIRLWREICARAWPCWPVLAAVSYSHNAMHSGNLYRFDGWTKISENCGSSGGGTYSTKRKPGEAHHGKKTLWLYRFDSVQGGVRS